MSLWGSIDTELDAIIFNGKIDELQVYEVKENPIETENALIT